MDIKDILLVVSADAHADANDALFAVAAEVALAQGAFVRGLCLVEEPDPTVAESFARGPAAMDEVLTHRDQQVHQVASVVQAKFQQAMADAGVAADWRLGETDEAVETTSTRARYADLVIVAQPGEHDHDARARVESLILSSGSPCLVTPPAAPAVGGLRRIVIGWDGGVAARRALDASLPFLALAQTVEIAVVEDGAAPEVNEAAIDALIARLARHGVRAEPRRFGKGLDDAGAALLTHVATFDADLLVMGAYSHSRAAEAIVGGVTRTVLTQAALPVLLAH